MKKLFAVFALAVLAVSAPAAFADGEYPNIVGRWVGYIMAINQQCARSSGERPCTSSRSRTARSSALY